jgi:hypothetical protein
MTLAQQFRQEGVQKGEAALIMRQLTHRVGTVPAPYRERLEKADAKTLLVLGEKVLEAQALQDVFES